MRLLSVSSGGLQNPGRSRWWLPALLVAVVVAYFAPMLLGSDNFGSDGQAAAYSAGLQLWSSSWATGWPVVGDPLGMVLYPLRVVLAGVQAAFDVFVVTAYLVAIIGMYAYLRCLVDRLPAAFGAVAFSLSGWMLVHLGHTSMIHAAAWLPWVMLGVYWACCGSRAQRLVGTGVLGLAVGMGLAAGHAQITVYSLLLAGFYTLFLVFTARAWAGLLYCSVGVLLGILIAAPALFPAIEWTGHTLRSELTREELFAYSFPLSETPGLILPLLYGSTPDSWFGVEYRVPTHLGETITFLPTVGTLLCMLALLGPVRRRQVIFMALYGLLALLLAMGDRLAGAGFITEHVFPLSMFRAPSRHLLEVTFCFSVLSAIGLQGLGDGRLRGRQIRWAGLALVLLLGVAIALAVISSSQMALNIRNTLKPVLFATLAVVASLCVLALAKRKGAMGVGWLALAVLLVQTWLIGYQLSWRLGEQNSSIDAAAEWAPDFQQQLGSDYRGLAMDGWQAVVFNPDASRLHGVDTLGWYGPLLNQKVVQLTGLTSGGWIQRFVLSDADATLDLLAVRYVAVPEAERGVVDDEPERWRFMGAYGNDYLYENLRVLPRARLACHAVMLKDDSAFVDAVRGGSGELSLGDTAYVNEGQLEPAALAGDCTAPVRIVEDRGDALRLEVDNAAGPALLVLADLWYPGWVARVNGEEKPVLRVNNTSRAVLIEGGDNVVELKYRPTRWGASLLISLLGLGLLLSMLIAGLWCWRKTVIQSELACPAVRST